MMKKLLALALTLCLLLANAVAFAEATDEPVSNKTEAIGEITQTHLNVASMSQMTGGFFTNLWGNNTVDEDVRALLHGMSTVAWTYNGEYAMDETVVANVETTANAEGDVTYRFTLADGLVYCDGTPITAADYVFSVLLMSSPLLPALNAVNDGYTQFVGSEAYRAGESAFFSGVRLLDDKTFSLTVRAEALPYYYELMYVEVTPYPISVLAPGCVVADDGEGAYIDDSALEGGLTAELLTEIIFGENGYRTHPAVTSGPYMLVSYDEDAHVAEFAINPNYPGNFEGQKPIIETLTFGEIARDDVTDSLTGGAVDLVNKLTDGALIDELSDLMRDEAIGGVTYLRSGYGFIAFACEASPTDSLAVRKAVAYCTDSEAFVNDFMLGYGLPVYAYYGYGQSMAVAKTAELEELNVYQLDLDAARTQLVEDGWILNADGDAFTEGEDEVRYKKIDGALTPLTLSWAVPENSGAADVLVQMLTETLPQVGVEVKVTELPFSELLAHYYRETDRTYDMFFLATNFPHVFDPYYTYSTDEAYQGSENTSGLLDEQLMALAYDMRRTESGDEEAYLEKWMTFQRYWAEVLPTCPIYSNVYYDFYRADLQNYMPNTHWSWAASILYSWIGAPVEGEPADDGEIVIE